MNCHRHHDICNECWWDEILGRRQCNHYYRYEPYSRHRYYRYDDRYERDRDLEAVAALVFFVAKFAVKQVKNLNTLRVKHFSEA